ncbi:MAG: hypothetical protein AAF619_00240 [Pseudomonadota bacterium]
MPSSPNFYRILSDTIEKAGLHGNEAGRQDVYRRARATVVDRARANNAPNVDELETHLNAAIEQIETELAPQVEAESPLAEPESAAERRPLPSFKPAQRPETTSNDAPVPRADGLSIEDVLKQNRKPSVEPSQPTPAQTAPQRTSDAAPGKAANKSNIGSDSLADTIMSGKNAGTGSLIQDTVDVDEPSIDDLDKAGAASTADAEELDQPDKKPSGGFGGGLGALFSRRKKDTEVENQPDPGLDRIAADLAAGFKEIDFDKDTSPAKPKADPDWLEPRKPDPEPLPASDLPDSAALEAVEDLPEIAQDLADEADPAFEEDIEQTPGIGPAPKTNWVRTGGLMILALAFGFWIGTIASSIKLSSGDTFVSPDAANLAGPGWRRTLVDVQPATEVTWNGFRVSDTSDVGRSSILLPIGNPRPSQLINVSFRLLKAERVEPSTPKIRVVFETVERWFIPGIDINLSDGQVSPSGGLDTSAIAVVDEGNNFLVTLTVQAPEDAPFRNPYIEVVPAHGTFGGEFAPGATGSVVIGDFSVALVN